MKVRLFIAILFFCPLLSYAQSWEELSDSMVIYYEKNDFQKAIPVAEKAVLAAKKEFGDNHPNYISAIGAVAALYHKTGRDSEALPLRQLRVEYYKNTKGANSLEYAKELNQLGIVYDFLNDLSNAIVNYEASCLILQQDTTQKNLYSEVLNNLVSAYVSVEKLDEAEKTCKKLLALKLGVFGRQSEEYNSTLQVLSIIYRRQIKYAESEKLRIELVNFYRLVKGDQSASYAEAVNNLGLIYDDMSLYDKAEPLFLEAANLRKKIFGDQHRAYLASMNNLANVYEAKGQYLKAEPIYQEVIRVQLSVLGENNVEYAQSLNNLGVLYLSMGLFDKAEPLHQQALAICERVLGTKHADYASSLNALGRVYYEKAMYKEAEKYYLESMNIRKDFLNGLSPQYSTSLNNLALLYKDLGKYDKAESYLQQCVNIRKKIYGDRNSSYADALNNLAVFYSQIGQYEKARGFFMEVIPIYTTVFGDEHPSVARTLSNLAGTYKKWSEFEKAKALYEKAIAIRKSLKEQEQPEFATVLNNLAVLYSDHEDHSKAKELLEEVARIREKALGKNHVDYGSTLINLGVEQQSLNDIPAAISSITEGVGILRNGVGPYHKDYADGIGMLGLLFQAAGDYSKAVELQREVQRIEVANLNTTFEILSEKEKANYITNKLFLNDNNNSLLYNYPAASKEFYRENFQLQLLLKSLILSSTKNVLESIRNSSDSALRATFGQWEANKKTLAIQYSLPLSNRLKDLKNLEDETELLEKQLSRKSTVFNKERSFTTATIPAIQQQLKTNEAVIEFVKFRVYKNKWTDSTIYAAYILTKDNEVPVFVPLCEEQQLQNIFDSAGTTTTSAVGKLYRGLEIQGKSGGAILGTELYKLIWQPLEPFLKGITRINYSPAGKLYNIAFHALPLDSTRILLDKYQLLQFASTRQVALRNDESIIPSNSVVFFGGASFTIDSAQLAKNKKINTAPTSEMPVIAKEARLMEVGVISPGQRQK